MRQHKQFPGGSGEVYVRDCGYEACDPGHSFGPAVRDYYLLHIVSAGKGMFYNQWGGFEVTAGQGFMIFPHEVTTYTADEKQPWVYNWVGYSGAGAAGITGILAVAPKAPVLSLGEHGAKATRILQEMYEDSASLNLREMAAMGGLYRLAALAGQCAETPGGKKSGTAGEQYFQRAWWHMQANFQRSLHITDVAGFVGLSRSQLFRVFIANCGMSPQQALAKMRLEQAEILLRTTELPLKAVALSSGFLSAARMGEVFKQEKGMTPTQFRNG